MAVDDILYLSNTDVNTPPPLDIKTEVNIHTATFTNEAPINQPNLTHPDILILNINNKCDLRAIINNIDEKHQYDYLIILSNHIKENITNITSPKNTIHITKTDPEYSKTLSKYIENIIDTQEMNNENLTRTKELRIIKAVNDISKYTSDDASIEDQLEPCLEEQNNVLQFDKCILTLNTHKKQQKEEIIIQTPNKPNGKGRDFLHLETEHESNNKNTVSAVNITNQSALPDQLTENQIQTHIISGLTNKDDTLGHIHLIDYNAPNRNMSTADRELIQLVAKTATGLIKSKNRKTELKHKIRKLQKFRYIISHDIISPLSTAKGRIEMAKHNLDNNNVNLAFEAINRIEGMIDSTERLLETEDTIEDRTEINIKEIAEDSWSIISTPNAKLEIPNDFTIYGDQDQVKTILENLFKNAVEHGGEGITIYVREKQPIQTSTRADPDGNRKLIIEDDGVGIPDSVKKDLFKEGTTTKHNEDISGYGLSIVKTAVNAHGWNIHVKDSLKGGAKFIIESV